MTEKQLLKKIGLRIKELRTAKDLSQRELGYIIDVEKSNVSRIESGVFNTKIITLFKIAKALEISLPELLKVDDKKQV